MPEHACAECTGALGNGGADGADPDDEPRRAEHLAELVRAPLVRGPRRGPIAGALEVGQHGLDHVLRDGDRVHVRARDSHAAVEEPVVERQVSGGRRLEPPQRLEG
jgi:hypothetical protein